MKKKVLIEMIFIIPMLTTCTRDKSSVMVTMQEPQDGTTEYIGQIANFDFTKKIKEVEWTTYP